MVSSVVRSDTRDVVVENYDRNALVLLPHGQKKKNKQTDGHIFPKHTSGCSLSTFASSIPQQIRNIVGIQVDN